MLKTIHKIKFKTDKIADLLADVKKPMSLNEIMSKYNVSYPFTVKCVKEFYNNHNGNSMGIIDKVLTYVRDSSVGYANSKELYNNQYKDSKKFILWE